MNCYLLSVLIRAAGLSPSHNLAVVLSKADDKPAVEGLRRAIDYTDKFACATNRLEIIEFDRSTGVEARLDGTRRPYPEFDGYFVSNAL